MIAKAAVTVLSNEKLRKGVGWTLVAILSPVIVLIALLCSIGSGGADHNNQAVAASFYGVSYSTEVPAEFRHHIEEMRTAFSCLLYTSVQRLAVDDPEPQRRTGGYPAPSLFGSAGDEGNFKPQLPKWR